MSRASGAKIRRQSWLLSLAIAALVLGLAPARAALVDGWTVFQGGPPGTPNLLANPGFESGSPASVDSWSPFGQGYQVDSALAHGGTRSIRLSNAAAADVRGAAQTVVLNQAVARPLYFSGFSRASGLSGAPGPAYSIYIDVLYTDGSPL